MNHLGTQLIYTGRFRLRPYRKGDEYQMYHNFLGDPLVTRYVTWETYQNIDVARQLLYLHLFHYQKQPRTYYEWAIEAGGELIGSVDAFNIQEDICACEIGCVVGSKYWGRGIATEALSAVIFFLFEEVGFHRVCATHHEKNTAAGIILENVGMRREGRLRSAVKNKDGTFGDLICYGVLKEDLQRKKHQRCGR